jgi:hypothetical protein
MNRSILALAASTALIISGPAYAQRGHGGGKPTTTPSTHGPSTTHGSSGATTHGSSGATQHGQSGSHGPATKPTSGGTTHGSGNAHASGSGNTHSTTKTTKSTASGTTSTTTSGIGSTTTLTPVQQKLQKNTNLADKLSTRLPKNTDLMDAADGFRNLGQFVAAVNVSNNLGLDFTELKTRMVDDGMSLGQAIQDTKKTVDVQTEVRKAETEADAMIKSTTTSTTNTSTTSPTTTSKKTKKTTGTK